VATYLFLSIEDVKEIHLVQNHPFIDGNKRTGFLSALIFLSLSGVYLEIEENEIDQMVLKVASSEMTKSDISK